MQDHTGQDRHAGQTLGEKDPSAPKQNALRRHASRETVDQKRAEVDRRAAAGTTPDMDAQDMDAQDGGITATLLTIVKAAAEAPAWRAGTSMGRWLEDIRGDRLVAPWLAKAPARTVG